MNLRYLPHHRHVQRTDVLWEVLAYALVAALIFGAPHVALSLGCDNDGECGTLDEGEALCDTDTDCMRLCPPDDEECDGGPQ